MAQKYGPQLKDPSTIYTYQKRFKLGIKSFQQSWENKSAPTASSNTTFSAPADDTLQVRLSENVVVRIVGLPDRIQKHQAAKLHRLIDAYVEEMA